MKSSEAVLRAIAAEGGTITGPRALAWIKELKRAGYLEPGDGYSWVLTEKARTYLSSKGVEMQETKNEGK